MYNICQPRPPPQIISLFQTLILMFFKLLDEQNVTKGKDYISFDTK